MRAPKIETLVDRGIYDENLNSEIYPILIPNSSNTGSQIIEPEIVTPFEFPPINNSTIVELPQGSPIQNNTGTSTASNPNAVPSATTDGTKTYVDGGTTPDSNIIVKKPKPNYLTLGIIGVVGFLVVYKLFFNKKSE
jgi:hypothetical protein